MSQFCHLHCHSEYSLLDGMSKVDDMVKRAKELNQPAIALTDHGVMFGAIEFYRAAKKAGVKPIMGVEAYLAARTRTDRDPVKDKTRFHMLLLAENQKGYLNLLKLCSIAQLEGFYGKPRIDRETLAAHSEGIIATTGCLAAEIPRTLMREGEEAAYNKLKWYLDVFGRDRFFLELQGHDIEELRGVNKTLIEWSKKYGVNLIATNDVHYVRKEDADPHDALLCIQTHDVLSKQNRMRLSPMGSYYITSFEEMMGIFGDYPEALQNTVLIAERCEVDLEHKGYHLPQFPIPTGYEDAEGYLKALVLEGITRRYGAHRMEVDPILKERVERELFIIHNMGFDNYFLIVWDLCRFAGEVDIWWNVRGSGAGSVVAYALKITNIDPIKNDLIFERFLNPDRVSMPDIDIDFPDDRRSEMIEYAVRKYGAEKVAAIITFGTLGARAAVRDVGRVLEIPLNEVDRVARFVPNVPGKPVNLDKLLFDDAMLEEWPTEATDLREVYKNEPQTKRLLDMAMKLEGQTRHASTHAAGIVISDKPIVEYAPLHRPTKGDDTGPIQQVVQFDMNIVESIGLLKVDFLGLATITIMRRACELIEQRHGRKLNMDTIPYERTPDNKKLDKDVEAAFKLLQAGDTIGVFQVEGAGLRRVLTEMRPTEFEHIIAAISLYRPGPLEYIPQYIRRMHGDEPIQYHHPLQEPILQNTFGICVSGDAMVMDARTGERMRLAEVGNQADFVIQGVDAEWRPAIGRVTHWINSGWKPVYRMTLRNGASIKVTADHRLLSESGWQPLSQLEVGDKVGTPPYLIGDNMVSHAHVYADTHHEFRFASLMATSELTTLQIDDIAVSSLVAPSGATRNWGWNAETLPSPLATRHANVNWQEIISIEPVGTEHVYDLTVEGLHSFVADNIIVHNCVYQEQIMRMATDLAGYSPGEADLMRRAVSKKKAKDIEYHKGIFVKGATDKGIPQAAAERIYGDIEFFARYGFNKCVTGDTEVLDTVTGRLVKVADLYQEPSQLSHVLSVDTDKLKYRTKSVANVVENGVKPVFQLTTAIGHTLSATDNHPFYTREGWRLLGELKAGDEIAVARHIPVRGHEQWDDVEVLELGRLLVDGELTEFAPEVFMLNNTQIHLLLSRLGLEAKNSHTRFVTPSRRLGQQLLHLYLRMGLLAKLESLPPREGVAEEWGITIIGDYTLKEDLYWDRITAIDPIGEAMTYDLEVEETHNFIANNILVHNSHAADYAVITVQTAYLKAHYPVEYLCALLEVEFNDTNKVPVFLSECRRMGITVLPPDLNKSGAKFTIEPNPNGDKYPQGDYRCWAIRVGMGAIKNVGLGAVEFILAEREKDGIFKSLDDFCDRVDLRQINRRVLECLTKVGVFDDIVRPHAPDAPRETMLELLDRMIGVSSQSHEAADVGQLSMFDMMASSGGQMTRGSVLTPLPVLGKINPKQRLADEKELMGLYISEHPLQQVAELVKGKVSYYCNEITTELIGQNVAVAGLLVSHRVITTKKGDRMAFLKLEDMQGDIEIVVFPRTYEQCKADLVPEAILLVAGKVEARNDTFSLLADKIVAFTADATVDFTPRIVEEVMEFYGEMPPLPDEAMEPRGSYDGTGIHNVPVVGNGYTNGNGHGNDTPAEVDLLDGSQRIITLTLPRTEDTTKDVTRLRQMLDLIRANEGGDTLNINVTLPNGIQTRLGFGDLKVRWTAQVREELQRLNIDFTVQDITPDPKARYRKEKTAV
jgi:DNA polymerase III alpha subunit